MILYFSGTGNTRFVARRLAGILCDELLCMEPREKTAARIVTGKRVVWCFPTYSWGVPPVVADFIKNTGLEFDPEARHFMVTTCGDDMGYADRQWRKLIRQRGWISAGAFAIQMPNTYVLMKGFDTDSPDVATKKLAASMRRVEEVGRAIENYAPGSPDMLIRGSFPMIKTSVIYPWFVRHAMSPKPFHATAACVGCGRCATTCPCANITMEKEAGGYRRPQWHDHCALCLRCYHICPQHAVAYGKTTDGKGQYINPDLMEPIPDEL